MNIEQLTELMARKGSEQAIRRPLEFRVRFASVSGCKETLEGIVDYMAGDALVTGTVGETWPVSRKRFEKTYVPRGDLQMGRDGLYVRTTRIVMVRRLDQAVSVPLTDQRGYLAGRPGDWLVQYGPGDFAVVAGKLFHDTYELLDEQGRSE